jgi:3,4-dihydroxy 2-butanone 4-phosphate synthase/GTP cyclohydrolase II
MFSSIPEAIEEIRAGRMVVVVDDEDRENEGDLAMAAEWVTPEAINFMASKGRGLICCPLTAERLQHLDIPLMVEHNTATMGTAFCVSVDARDCQTNGASAADRAHTVRRLLDPDTRPSDLVRPGHIFPIRSSEGGVLRRAGHTEAVIDLARLAGLQPAGVICEIMNDDGSMARLPELTRFAAEHGLKVISIAAFIEYRLSHETLVRRIAETRLPTEWGEFRVVAFQNDVDGGQHLALVMGEPAAERPALVRVQVECLTGDARTSRRCRCREHLEQALRAIARRGEGVLVYLRLEGAGDGLLSKLWAYQAIDEGKPVPDPHHTWDPRDYGTGAQILRALGLKKIEVLSGDPRRLAGIRGYGLDVIGHVPLDTDAALHAVPGGPQEPAAEPRAETVSPAAATGKPATPASSPAAADKRAATRKKLARG